MASNEDDALFILEQRYNVRVEYEYIGEGWNGEYNPDDELDQPLYRFTVYYKDDDVESYCTAWPIGTSEATLRNEARNLLEEVFIPVVSGDSIRRICGAYSWHGPRGKETGLGV